MLIEPRDHAGRLAHWLCVLVVALAQASDAKPLDTLVEEVLSTSPEIAAARSEAEAAEARLQGSTLPLNNPELEAEYERTDVDTLRVGLTQTLDWHGKRAALERMARLELELARTRLEALRSDRAHTLLRTAARIHTLEKALALARDKVKVLERFEKLALRRQRAGDLSSNDLAMARLSLAEARMARATRKAELIEARSRWIQLTGRPLAETVEFPSLIDWRPPALEPAKTAESHPQTRMARLEAQLARQRIEAVDRERKPDPTLGVAGGREGDENLFVLSFALPLQVRNRGEAEVQATRLEVVAAEQRARQIQLDVKSRLAAADARYRLLHATWARWIEEGLPSLSQRVALLERLWQAGETSTTDHLIQVQQLLDTRMAGVDFEGELRLAWIDLLEASGALGRLEQIMRK